MKRTLFVLAFVAMTAALAAQMTGVFIGGRQRTLYVGSEPFCLVFPQEVTSGKVDTAGFALAIQGNMVCFTAIAPKGESRATLIEGEKTLTYVLKARKDAPSAEIRVLFPNQGPAKTVAHDTPAPKATSDAGGGAAATKAKPGASPAEAAKKPIPTVPLPVPKEVQQRVVMAAQDPVVARLASMIDKLDRVLAAQQISDSRYLPETATVPHRDTAAANGGGKAVNTESAAETSQDTAQADVKAPVTKGGEAGGEKAGAAAAKAGVEPKAESTVGRIGYDPVEDPLPKGVRVMTSLVPGRRSWRITYTLYNEGKYPLITDPTNVRVLFNGQSIDAGELKQRASSGYAGWVPPGYEEVGSVEIEPLQGEGELRLEFTLTRLSPERERLLVVRRWKITTMPYVVPNKP